MLTALQHEQEEGTEKAQTEKDKLNHDSILTEEQVKWNLTWSETKPLEWRGNKVDNMQTALIFIEIAAQLAGINDSLKKIAERYTGK